MTFSGQVAPLTAYLGDLTHEIDMQKTIFQ